MRGICQDHLHHAVYVLHIWCVLSVPAPSSTEIWSEIVVRKRGRKEEAKSMVDPPSRRLAPNPQYVQENSKTTLGPLTVWLERTGPSAQHNNWFQGYSFFFSRARDMLVLVASIDEARTWQPFLQPLLIVLLCRNISASPIRSSVGNLCRVSAVDTCQKKFHRGSNCMLRGRCSVLVK